MSVNEYEIRTITDLFEVPEGDIDEVLENIKSAHAKGRAIVLSMRELIQDLDASTVIPSMTIACDGIDSTTVRAVIK